MIYSKEDLVIGFEFRELEDQHRSEELIQTIGKIYYDSHRECRVECLRTRCGQYDYRLLMLLKRLNDGTIIEHSSIYELY